MSLMHEGAAMPRGEHRTRGARHRRRSKEDRAALGSARRVVDPDGRRWLVRHENADVLLNSWGTVIAELAPLIFWRYMRKHGVSAIFAECADGTSHRIGLGRHASVRDALNRVASAIADGEPLPERIDS